MSSLELKLAEQIDRLGRITFRDFMHAALYDPEFGYYNTDHSKIGASGDYYTSSNVHSAFGSVLADCFVRLLPDTGQDSNPGGVDSGPGHSRAFHIVEIGAGTGQLALDVITALQSRHAKQYQSLKYLIIETSRAMREIQKGRLAAFSAQVTWTDLPALQASTAERGLSGIIFSNELIDALPVHVVRMHKGNLRELYVGAGKAVHAEGSSIAGHPPMSLNSIDGRLQGEWGQPSTSQIRDYVIRFVPSIREGQVIEVNLAAIEMLRTLSGILSDGHIFTIDYGDLAPRLFGVDRHAGTLRAFRNHAIAPWVLASPGEQDITASVNFSALIDYGKEFGLETVSYEPQSSFLMRYGLLDKIEVPASFESDVSPDLKDRLALKNLFVPGGSSDNFRVHIQHKTRPGSAAI